MRVTGTFTPVANPVQTSGHYHSNRIWHAVFTFAVIGMVATLVGVFMTGRWSASSSVQPPVQPPTSATHAPAMPPSVTIIVPGMDKIATAIDTNTLAQLQDAEAAKKAEPAKVGDAAEQRLRRFQQYLKDRSK